MMANMFDMFDPSTNFISMNWMSLFLPALAIMKPMYKMKNRSLFIFKKINYLMKKDLKKNLKKSHIKIMIVLMTAFNSIWLMNMLSLLPFIFTPTSHMSLTMMLSFPVWMSLTLKNMFKDSNNLMIHLVPNNTPLLLAPFMTLIESISLLMRPFTLMIRLTANMIAGHVLISLLSQLLNFSLLIYLTTSMIMNILLILEMSVAMIQAYVFTILLCLMINESN